MFEQFEVLRFRMQLTLATLQPMHGAYSPK